MIRKAWTGTALAVALAGGPAPVEAQVVRAGDVVTIASGEVREGDLYAAAEAVRVNGRLNGDLVAGARRILVDGRVDGDLFAAVQAGGVDKTRSRWPMRRWPSRR